MANDRRAFGGLAEGRERHSLRKNQAKPLDGSESQLGVAGRIRLAARTIWGRIVRPKRNGSISVWPEHGTVFIVLAAAFIALAAHFDGQITNFMAQTDNWFLRTYMRAITDAAKSHYYLIPALMIMTVISSMDWTTRNVSAQKLLVRAYERAAFVFVSIIVPGIFVNIVKQLVGRGRPRTFDEYGAYVFSPFEFTHQFQSFPSGHATTAGAIGMLIALYFPALRWPALILAGVLAFARVAVRAHYLSDAMTGYLIGTVATLIFARWLASRAIMFNLAPGAILPTLKK